MLAQYGLGILAKTHDGINWMSRWDHSPYAGFGPRLMISLPFPFEREETAAATREVLEFTLVLSAVFFLTVIALARGIGSMLVTPIRKLLEGTREASLGNLDFVESLLAGRPGVGCGVAPRSSLALPGSG